MDDGRGPHGHPYLHEPLLYISNVPAHVSDQDLAVAFVACGPFRPHLARDPQRPVVSGTIEFRFLDNAEKALATLQARPVPATSPPVPLVLSPYPPTSPPTPLPPPSALPRLVKHLPPGYADAQLYDLFRPFGALASARTHTHFGPDTASVEFWNEDDARAAEHAMHCADVDGHNIAVHVYHARPPTASLPANAPPFVPSPRSSPYSPLPPPFVHGPGQQVQLAPLHGPGSSSHSGLIDPCNLFCKNLDPAIDSNHLFSHFRTFGQIVSARVMRNEAGDSRGFGFVSFQTPTQASNAMHAMNGVQLGSKQIVVRLHEPKQLRQEKLAQRFGHPRSASGATSPAASDAGDSYVAFSSPRRLSAPLSPDRSERERSRRGSASYYNAALSGTLNIPMRYDDLAGLSPVVRKEVLTGELARRVKDLHAVADEDLSSVVDSLVALALSEVVQCIEDPVKLQSQVNTLQHSLHPPSVSAPAPAPASAPALAPSPASAQIPESSTKSISPAPSATQSQDSRLLEEPNAANATASAPEHPSTPVSVSPPRTSSPPAGASSSSFSLPLLSSLPLSSLSLPLSSAVGGGLHSGGGGGGQATERERMLGAVCRLENARQGELVELLMSLPKRERAMCLFNAEVLRVKLADAKVVLESEEEGERSERGEGERGERSEGEQGEGDARSTRSTRSAPSHSQSQSQSKSATLALAPPVTPQMKKAVSVESPKTPELSSRGPSAASSPVPGTPAAAGAVGGAASGGNAGAGAGGGAGHTLTTLAKLPASEIIRLARAQYATLGLNKPDEAVVKATDEFVDGLVGMQVQMQKQLLGDKLFKVVKSFGIKGAPKVTIALLDQEDLRSLAHLMNSYPALLREKAVGLALGK